MFIYQISVFPIKFPIYFNFVFLVFVMVVSLSKLSFLNSLFIYGSCSFSINSFHCGMQVNNINKTTFKFVVDIIYLGWGVYI